MYGGAGFLLGPPFEPYPSFTGGVRVATCDLDGDGFREVITGTGPGGGPHVRAIRLNPDHSPRADLANFFAYEPGYRGGLFVACGDVDGNGVPDIITSTDEGGGPHVRVFAFVPAALGGVVLLTEFMAYETGFRGGVRVAAGDVDQSGRDSIILGAGPGGGPHVRALKLVGGALQELAGFFVYDAGFRGGVFVAADDLDGDGRAEIITGAGAGGGPHVRVFTGTGADTGTGFFAYDPGVTTGVHVGTMAPRTILTGPGAGTPHVRGFDAGGAPVPPQFIASVGPPLQFVTPALPAGRPGQAYAASVCQPPPASATSPCGVPAATANPTGGIPPYHFELGAFGRPPRDVELGLNGLLTGPIALSADPRDYTFTVCVFDLVGAYVCRSTVLTVVTGAANPFQGSIAGSWSGACDGFPVGGGFSVTIDAAGRVTGSFYGSDSGPISGTVDNSGHLSAFGAGAAGAYTWTGQFSRAGSALGGSGSWSGPGCGGGWSGSGAASG